MSDADVVVAVDDGDMAVHVDVEGGVGVGVSAMMTDADADDADDADGDVDDITSADYAVKARLTLYKVQRGIYLLDFMKSEGDPFSYMTLCARIIGALKVLTHSLTHSLNHIMYYCFTQSFFTFLLFYHTITYLLSILIFSFVNLLSLFIFTFCSQSQSDALTFMRSFVRS